MKKKTSKKKIAKKDTSKKNEVLEKKGTIKKEDNLVVNNKKKKRKKHHPGLIIIGVLVFLLVGVPAIIAFGFIYDTSTKDVPSTKAQFTEVVDKAVAQSLHQDELQQGVLKLSLDGTMLDSTLMYVRNSLATSSPQAGQFIPKMYCYVSGDNYDFCVEVKASFFKTRIMIRTTIDSGDGSAIIHFKINSVKIGRLSIPGKWLSSILNMAGITDEKITQMFTDANVRMKCSISNLELTYNRKEFKEDVGPLLNVDNNPFISILLEILGDKDNGILEVNYADKIEAKFNFINAAKGINLSEDIENEKTKKTNHFIDSSSMDTIANLLSGKHEKEPDSFKNIENVITDDNAQVVFTYLFRGWEQISEEAQESIKKINDSTKGFILDSVKVLNGNLNINGLADYQGASIGNKGEFNSICDDKIDFKISDIESIAEDGSPILKVYDESINKFFAGFKDLIGTGIIFLSQDNGVKYCDYISIDNLFVDFITKDTRNIMNIYMNTSIDGFPLCITMPTSIDFKLEPKEEDGNDIATITLDPIEEGFKMGSYVLYNLNEDLPKSLLDSIGELLPTEGDFTYSDSNFVIKKDTGVKISEQLTKIKCGFEVEIGPKQGEIETSTYLGLIAKKK